MIEKKCLICGKKFKSSIKNKKLCSDECRKRRRKQWLKQYMNEYYKNNPEYREYRKEYFKENREQIKKNKKRWQKTPKGKKYIKKVKAKYKAKSRDKKWIQILPNIFPDNIRVDYHHVDGKSFVVALPKTIHNAFNKNLDKHLEHNKEWIEFYYNFDVAEFLSDIPMELQK